MISLFAEISTLILLQTPGIKMYVTLLLAFDFKCQRFERTRVTPTSETCLDHVITSCQVKTDTIQTTQSDHFTVLFHNF